MILARVPNAQHHLDALALARESLIAILSAGDFSIIEEAFIEDTASRLRDLQYSARLSKEE